MTIEENIKEEELKEFNWRNSKFKALGKLSLAIRFSIYILTSLL